MRRWFCFVFTACTLFSTGQLVDAKTEKPVVVETPVNETVAPSEKPTPKEAAIDTNRDGKPDRWEHYDHGVPVKVEADTNFDGKVDEWAIFVDGKLSKVEKDTDYDGKPDSWITY